MSEDPEPTGGVMRNLSAGFTLIELLVAAAITVLIAGVLTGLISTALTNWNRSQGALTTEEQARAALDRLEQDLSGAICRDDGNVWLAATVQSDASASGVWVNGAKPGAASLYQAAPNLADARFGIAGVWLRFFATVPAANARELAAPVAVSYQIVRRAPTISGTSCEYLLYRSEVTASATLAAGYDLGALAYTTASDVVGSTGNVVRPGYRQVLADNVIDFGVRFYAFGPDPATGGPQLQQIFPVEATDLEYRVPRSVAANSSQRFPSVVEVLLRILTEEGARRVAALEAGQITGDWWAIASANSKVFVRRIQLKADSP